MSMGKERLYMYFTWCKPRSLPTWMFIYKLCRKFVKGFLIYQSVPWYIGTWYMNMYVYMSRSDAARFIICMVGSLVLSHIYNAISSMNKELDEYSIGSGLYSEHLRKLPISSEGEAPTCISSLCWRLCKHIYTIGSHRFPSFLSPWNCITRFEMVDNACGFRIS